MNKQGRSFPPGETLTISRANANDTGDYNCTASNSAGSAMASATITVKSKYKVKMLREALHLDFTHEKRSRLGLEWGRRGGDCRL